MLRISCHAIMVAFLLHLKNTEAFRPIKFGTRAHVKTLTLYEFISDG
jgi:hypothetical protein